MARSLRRLRTSAALGSVFSLLVITGQSADDWPQWRGQDRGGVWHESGVVERFPVDGLMTTWRVPIRPGFRPGLARPRPSMVTVCMSSGRAAVGERLFAPRAFTDDPSMSDTSIIS